MAMAPMWQKSSFSSDEDAPNCVELTATAGTIRLRESEAPTTELSTSPAQLASLIRSMKSRAGVMEGQGRAGRSQDAYELPRSAAPSPRCSR